MARLTRWLFTDRLFAKINERLVTPAIADVTSAIGDTDERLRTEDERLRATLERLATDQVALRTANTELHHRMEVLAAHVEDLVRRLADANEVARVRQRELAALSDALARVRESAS